MKIAFLIAGLGAALAVPLVHADDKHDSRSGSSACAREFNADFGDRWVMTRKQAKRLVAFEVPGKVVSACADRDDIAEPHYHLDVRMPHGPIARLQVDATSGEIAWRQPAVLED